MLSRSAHGCGGGDRVGCRPIFIRADETGWAGMTGQDEDGDPLLVRPYLRDEQAIPAPRSPESSPSTASASAASAAETWPEPGEPSPARGTPAVAAPGPGRRPPVPLPHSRRVLLACLTVLALTVASGLAFALWPGSDPADPGLADRPLPAVSATDPADPAAELGGGTGSPSAASSSAPLPRRRTTIPADKPDAAATGPGPTTASAARPATSAPAGAAPGLAAPTPAPTLSPAPAAARVGVIGADGGLCLDLNGAVAVDDNHVQVFECNRTAAQVWTLATDGTLRVMDKCAQVIADGTVHITGCDSREAAQWRAGRNQSLVNVATNDCLTDPAAGTRSGAGVRVSDCAGAGNQRWQLP